VNAYFALSHRLLGRWTSTRTATLVPLQRALFRAHRETRADVHLSGLWMAAGLAGLAGLLLGTLVALAAPLPPALRALLPLALAGTLFGWALALGPFLLRNQANELGKAIDEDLPHGLNYLLALASAGLTPRDMWGSLARAEVFGPLAYEAGRIRRDLDLFGDDLISALRAAQGRTASRRFDEFLQGAISAFQSGVDLENYLKTKGAQSQRQAVEEQLKSFDAMGIMAEAFLTTVVAGPLFLIILLTVMTVNQGKSVLLWGYVLVLAFIPLAQIVVGTLIKGMNPKVWT
jgi:flagellar protein FlaJ